MPKKTSPVPSVRRSLLLLCAPCALGAVRAQQPAAGPATQLSPYVTTATRTPADPQTLGSAVETLDAAELARRQVSTFTGALNALAGGPLSASGATGSVASLFLRGANSNQTLFLVDGIRFNDSSTDHAVFLGGMRLGASDRLEVAHGPQSTLYGAEAVGGVVSLRTPRGTAGAASRVTVEGGSFGTVQGSLAAQGEQGPNAFNVSVQGGRTDNDRANNAFESSNAVVRLDRTLNERIAVGGTLRWFGGTYGEPGDRFTNDPDNQSHEQDLLGTAFADLKLAPAWTAHAVLGGQSRRYVSENPEPTGAKQVTVVKNRRGVFDAQTTYAGFERHRLTAGLTSEVNHTRNTGFGDIDKKQTLLALFAQDEYSPVDDVYLTAGLRNDDFDTFGHATTGRATAAWLVAQRALKLRASYGTAFRSPSFLDLYGQSAFYVGNPDLRPERARGWDAGADYYLPGRRGTLSVTWFETRFTRLIASTPDYRSVENIQEAKTRGAEVSAQVVLPGALEVRAAYTWLEADNLTADQRLLRRPRHRGSVDVWRDFGAGFSLGAGVVAVAQREDIDAATYGRIDGEDYAVARVYAEYRVNARLAVKARLENALDEQYEEVNGFPALGRGVFAGVEWKF